MLAHASDTVHNNGRLRLQTETTITVSKMALSPMKEPQTARSARTAMNSDCPDGYCRQKIQAIDNAIGHKKNEWSTILYGTQDYSDVSKALRFCEVFHLESKVSVTSKGYIVQYRNDIGRGTDPKSTEI